MRQERFAWPVRGGSKNAIPMRNDTHTLSTPQPGTVARVGVIRFLYSALFIIANHHHGAAALALQRIAPSAAKSLCLRSPRRAVRRHVRHRVSALTSTCHVSLPQASLARESWRAAGSRNIQPPIRRLTVYAQHASPANSFPHVETL